MHKLGGCLAGSEDGVRPNRNEIELVEEAFMTSKGSARRAPVRIGRPPKGLAGAVEERILGAARKVFLERGFEGASIEEIARRGRALGKAHDLRPLSRQRGALHRGADAERCCQHRAGRDPYADRCDD